MTQQHIAKSEAGQPQVSSGVYETVIGLEVHVELATQTKIFCGCANAFGAEPNTHTCPVCLGHPGVLPVLNEAVVDYAMKAALALNCTVPNVCKFDRKNYFYPDNPKAYQITQNELPIGVNGWLEIDVQGEKKRIGIHHIHMEEDAGKLIHAADGSGSFVDYNRVGTPLIEIVSDPVLSSPEEVRAYLEKLRAIMLYCGVSDVKMEEGSLRCDANISLRPVGQEALGTKTELKNMNSFRGVERGLAYEIQRQTKVLNRGEKVIQETRRWDESTAKTISMRSKEEAHDYRYFPDPDLVKLVINDAWKQRMKDAIPELPDARRQRYVEQYELPAYDAGVLTSTRELADFFEEAVQAPADAKQVANWMMGEVLAYLNAHDQELQDTALTPTGLGKLVQLIEKGTISGKIGKQVFQEMITHGGDPEQIVEEKGLVQVSDSAELERFVQDVLNRDQSAQSIEDYKAGKKKAIGFLVGQVMKETKGKANPQMVNELLQKALAERLDS